MAKSTRRRQTAAPTRTLAKLIFAAALGLRILYLLSVRHAPFFAHLQTEPLHYDQWARLILDGRHVPHPPFEQAPGYAYFVAAVYALCGPGTTSVALVQAVLDAMCCVLIATAARTWFGARAGLIAGMLAAAYGPFVYFSAEMLPATLFVFITMLAFTASLPLGGSAALWQPSSPRRGTAAAAEPTTGMQWGVAGCLWSLTLLVRTEAVLGWPLVLWDAWRRGGRGALLRLGVPLVCVAGAFLSLNAAYSDRLVLFTTSSGVNLWLGNNPHADGVNPFIFGPLESVERSVRAQTTDGATADRLFRQQALAFWRNAPGEALHLLWKKFVWTWTGRELPNSSDIDWQEAQSWLFRIPLLPLGLGVILPFAAAGAVLVAHRWRDLLLMACPLVIGVGTSLVFFTNARFRLIMAPSLLILAAVGVEQGATLLSDWRRNARALWQAGAGMTCGLIAAWGNFYAVRTYTIPQINVNIGALEREAGDFAAAVQHLRAGVAGDPSDVIGWIHLALALEQQGQPRRAFQAYLDAAAVQPDDASLMQMAERFCQRHQLDVGLPHLYASTPDGEARGRLVAAAVERLPPDAVLPTSR